MKNDDMRILIGYNGTDFASAAIDGLSRAGLPKRAEVMVLTVAEMCFATVDRADAARLAESATGRIHKLFPEWHISTGTATGAAAGDHGSSRYFSAGPDNTGRAHPLERDAEHVSRPCLAADLDRGLMLGPHRTRKAVAA